MKVVYTVSEQIVPYVYSSINSLLAHNDVEKIWVFTDTDNVFNVPQECDVINISDQKWIDRNSPNVNVLFPWIARIRLAMAKLLPEEDKVLYFDADTIVCDSLEPLWETDMDGKWVGMVDEVNGDYKPFGEHYFNCGVILFNLAQIRKDGIDDKWIDFFNNNYIWLGEQDTLNKYQEEGKYVCLPSRYNEFTATGISDDPAIVHYAAIPDWYTHSRQRWMSRVEYLKAWL